LRHGVMSNYPSTPCFLNLFLGLFAFVFCCQKNTTCLSRLKNYPPPLGQVWDGDSWPKLHFVSKHFFACNSRRRAIERKWPETFYDFFAELYKMCQPSEGWIALVSEIQQKKVEKNAKVGKFEKSFFAY